MSVTPDAVGPAGGGGSSANGVTAGVIMTWTHTCTGANGCLYVAVDITVGSGGSDSGLSTTVTYNSVAMTSLAKVHSGGGTSGYVELFRLRAPSTGANTVSVTMAGTAASVIDCEGGSVSAAGVHQTTSEGTVFTNTANGTSVSVNVTGTTACNLVLDAMCTGTSITGPGGSQTQRWLKSNGTIGSANQAAQSTQPASGTITMSWTGGSDFWGIIAVEVLAAGGAAAGEANFPFMPGRIDDVLPGETRPYEVQSPAFWDDVAVAVASADISVAAYLPIGVLPYADATHDAVVSGHLPVGTVPYATVSHAASVSGLLPVGVLPYAPVSHDASIAAHLPVGVVPYAITRLDVPTIGYLPIGVVAYAPVSHDAAVSAHLPVGVVPYAPISHAANVAGLLPIGVLPYAPVSHDVSVAGHLPVGAVLYAIVSGGADISVVGYLPIGVALYAPVSHAATVPAYLPVGVDLRAPVSHTASVTGHLPIGVSPRADITHLATVVGYLPVGITMVAFVGAAPVIVYPTAFEVLANWHLGIDIAPSNLTVELASSSLFFAPDASGLWLPLTPSNENLDLD